MLGLFVLDDGRETSGCFEEQIVGCVVVDQRDLADHHSARSPLGVEFVIDEWRQPDRLAGVEHEAMAGRNVPLFSVERKGDRLVAETAVRAAAENLADEAAAA